MASSKPKIINGRIDTSVIANKRALNLTRDGAIQERAGYIYVEDASGYLTPIYSEDNYGNFQKVVRTTDKDDIYGNTSIDKYKEI